MSGYGHQQTQYPLPQIPIQSWYPQSMMNPSYASPSPNTAFPSGSIPPGMGSLERENGDSRTTSHVFSPASSSSSDLATAFPTLRNKSNAELQRLLDDKEYYNAYFHSLEQVKQPDSLQNDLRKNNVELAMKNLEKEAELTELSNQCTTLRSNKLAEAQKMFLNLQRQAAEMNDQFNPLLLFGKLQEAAKEADMESQYLHNQFLNQNIDLTEFLQRYHKLRLLYHGRTMTMNAASPAPQYI